MFNSVQLIRVTGHRGIDGNERADQLAWTASAQNFIGPEPATGISPSMVRSAILRWSVGVQYKL